jgi:hypothetical protein
MISANEQVQESPRFAGLKYAFVVFAAIISSRLWSFKGIPDIIYDGAEILLLFLLLLIVLLNYNALRNNKLLFGTNVWLFIAIPIVSSIAAAFFHDQSLFLSLAILRTNFVWLLYFVLHIFNIPVKKIIHLLLFIGVVWILITIVQQYTYPTYYFYTRSDDGDTEFIRAGIYRFMIDPYQYGLFVLFFFFWKLLAKWKFVNLAFVALALAGLYFFATRQILVGAVLCMILAVWMQSGRARLYSFVAFIFMASIGLLFQNELFGEYIQMTQAQLSTKDDIRLLAADFFLYDYWPHWITVITGNGLEHFNSSYGKELSFLSSNYGLYRSDVGIIGALNTYGIIYVLNIFWLMIRSIRVRLMPQERYLKLFFWFSMILCAISEQFSHAAAIPFFCFILYLIERSLDPGNQVKPSTTE